MGRPDYIFCQFRETARCRDVQYGDGVCVVSYRVVSNHRMTDALLTVSVLLTGKGDYGDIMLARVDAGPDAGQRQQQSLVVVKTLLSTAVHHQRAFQHEAEMFSRARHIADRHVVRLLGVCSDLQPPLIVTEYSQLVCSLSLYLATCLALRYDLPIVDIYRGGRGVCQIS